jgi:hemerythrin
MDKLVWDSSFSAGIEEIDAQHRDFFKLINRLQMAQDHDYSRQFMLRLAQELYRYAAYHFLSEENLMMVFNYPDLSTQQQEHEKLLQNLRTRVNDLEKGRADISALSDFVGVWLKNHTLTMDKKIGEYILHLRSKHS